MVDESCALSIKGVAKQVAEIAVTFRAMRLPICSAVTSRANFASGRREVDERQLEFNLAAQMDWA